MQQRGIRIAIDIGGTFTDGIAQEEGSERIWVGKCLTTPDDPCEGVLDVITALLAQAGEEGRAPCVSEVVHGTTLVTNTLIERTGANTGLVLTQGTGDVLDIRREVRYDLYDIELELPQPLVARAQRHELEERLDAAGNVVSPIAAGSLDAVCQSLQEQGVQAVAVCLLHGYLNDVHEQEVGRALRERLAGVEVSLSSQVARELREYERMSTTVANAYVQPLMRRYLKRLGDRMQAAGVQGPLRIMLSSGGFTSAQAATEVPILLLESGPAAGVLSAVNTGMNAGEEHILAFDMGGTTAKACVVTGGVPAVAHTFEAARVRRFKRGSGLPILIPSIDLIEIGAGGGSLADVDALGLLKVGPQSAGSVPGPACYGLGGTAASVTDADLVLGYLDASSFLGGEMPLDRTCAEQALGTLGKRLGAAAADVAWGIANIVNENMAAAARVHIAEKGLDPRRFTMVATGGAGPVHAVSVAHKLGITHILCPIAAGAGSCLGLLAAPARVDRAWPKPGILAELDWAEVRTGLEALRASAHAELASVGLDRKDIVWELILDMRYVGQGSTVKVALPTDVAVDPALEAVIHARFEDSYRALYGGVIEGAEIQVVTWRLSGHSGLRPRRFTLASERPGEADPVARERQVYLPAQSGYGAVPVYRRHDLPAGWRCRGPVIFEERESTLVVPFPAEIEILPDLTISVRLGD